LHRYSVTVSKSTLKRAKTPIQRKRLLSVAAAIGDEEREGALLGVAAGRERSRARGGRRKRRRRRREGGV
jgi:hypothetical protein